MDFYLLWRTDTRTSLFRGGEKVKGVLRTVKWEHGGAGCPRRALFRVFPLASHHAGRLSHVSHTHVTTHGAGARAVLPLNGVDALREVKGQVQLDISNQYLALDGSLYEDVLNAEQCHDQIRFIRSNPFLQIQFADAGIRTPRGFSTGNFVDLGNYHQCLGITHATDDMDIQGKYCTIVVPLNQDWKFPWTTKWSGFDPSSLEVNEEVISKVEQYQLQRAQMLASIGVVDGHLPRSMPGSPNSGPSFILAVCIPKSCSTQQAITSFLFNVSAIGFQYGDDFCRLPDDKPWSPADTVAVVTFSTIGVLTLLCTSYDLVYTLVLKRDPKQSSRLYTCFSAYTNGRRLMNFGSSPGTLHCLDGIRTWAMAWVVVGHSFSTEAFIANPIDAFIWIPSLRGLWITAAPITVDTFFCLAGILLVYTTVGKMNGVQLIKNLPLFYLNRLLRMFPLLATAVLLQASYFNRMSDGPHWTAVEDQTNYCRANWWLTLLHVQNYVRPLTMCLPHSWYIAIDVQLYIISPVVLFWVLGSSRWSTWAALVAGLLVALTAGTYYSFVNNFVSWTISFSRPEETLDYMRYYYFNTLTRAAPFFVGMLFGYVLHVCRGKKVKMSSITILFFWTCAALVSTTIFFYPHFMMQMDWDQQFVDNVMNSFMRPAWGAALCWLVFACTHGYGGPVNWFLTLSIWKLPARISYAIFIFHYPLMFVVNGAALAPTYFSVPRYTFKFLAHMSLSLVVAYFATLLIDAPFSTISKILLDGNKNKPVRSVTDIKKPDYQEIETNNSHKITEVDTNKNNVEINQSRSQRSDFVTNGSTDLKDTENILENDVISISDTKNDSNIIKNNDLEKSNQDIVAAIDVAFDPIHKNNLHDKSKNE